MNARHALFAVLATGEKVRCSDWVTYDEAIELHTAAGDYPARAIVTIHDPAVEVSQQRSAWVRYLATRGCDDPNWWNYDTRASKITVVSQERYRDAASAAKAALEPLGFYSSGGCVFHPLLDGPVARGWYFAAIDQRQVLHWVGGGVHFTERVIFPVFPPSERSRRAA